MKLIKNVAIGTITALIILVEVFLLWFYIANNIYNVAYTNGVNAGIQQIDNGIAEQYKQTGQLELNIDNEKIILVPQNEVGY